VELYVEDTGNERGRPVLFIHGLSQCRLAWRRQLHSPLSADLRMVALDLRGHGNSERPEHGYDDSALWAADIAAVIDTLGLDRPILCGWSYGGVVIGDYLRAHGDEGLGGVVLVAAISRLGEPVLPYLGTEFLATLTGLFSEDVQSCTSAVDRFIRLTTHTEPAAEDRYMAIGYTMAVAPQVRQGMLSRTVDHDEVFRQLTVPLLIVHGLEDEVVLPAMSEHLANLANAAQTSFRPGVGHTPFMEDVDQFNTALSRFVRTV
jgi:pimeloyl-ACP methyl ester carboxylesterase